MSDDMISDQVREEVGKLIQPAVDQSLRFYKAAIVVAFPIAIAFGAFMFSQFNTVISDVGEVKGEVGKVSGKVDRLTAIEDKLDQSIAINKASFGQVDTHLTVVQRQLKALDRRLTSQEGDPEKILTSLGVKISKLYRVHNVRGAPCAFPANAQGTRFLEAQKGFVLIAVSPTVECYSSLAAYKNSE